MLYIQRKREYWTKRKNLKIKACMNAWENWKKIQKERWDIEKWNSFILFSLIAILTILSKYLNFFFILLPESYLREMNKVFILVEKCWNIILSVNQYIQTPHLCSTLCTNTNYNIFPFNIVAMENWSLYLTNTNQRILHFNIRVTRN